VLAFYADYNTQAPDELYLDVALGLPPGGGEGFVKLQCCYSGPESGAARVHEQFKRLGTPAANEVKALDYVDLQRSGDITDPRANGMYLKSGFNSQVDASLISAILSGFQGHPGRMTQVFLPQCGGAIGRVATTATAFPHRYAKQSIILLIAWRAGDDPTQHMAWARKYWATLEPFTQGFYTNEVADESAQVIDANYRENLQRLVTLKKKYDPTNLFRLNANVRPG